LIELFLKGISPFRCLTEEANQQQVFLPFIRGNHHNIIANMLSAGCAWKPFIPNIFSTRQNAL
jgi:hypothetical protein